MADEVSRVNTVFGRKFYPIAHKALGCYISDAQILLFRPRRTTT
jgi:hypothetical protein